MNGKNEEPSFDLWKLSTASFVSNFLAGTFLVNIKHAHYVCTFIYPSFSKIKRDIV